MTDTQLLRKRIKKSGFKMQYIAEKLGISRFTLLQKIENKSDFRVSEVEALCNLLGIDSLEEKNCIFFAQLVEK